MGYFRFHRSIGNKLFRLNISKGGFSGTVGVPGAHLNVPLVGRRKRRSMATFGIPGTGLSYRQQIGKARAGGDSIPFFKQLLFFIIGAIVIASLWGMWS
jgi:hypothetical protein